MRLRAVSPQAAHIIKKAAKAVEIPFYDAFAAFSYKWLDSPGPPLAAGKAKKTMMVQKKHPATSLPSLCHAVYAPAGRMSRVKVKFFTGS